MGYRIQGQGYIDSLQWSASEGEHGKIIKIHKFPQGHEMKLFQVEVSTNRTDWDVTNDFAQNSTQEAQDACVLRWKIEQFPRAQAIDGSREMPMPQLQNSEKSHCLCRTGLDTIACNCQKNGINNI
jgi:hypothetical protein